MSYQILCLDDDPKFLLGIKSILKRKYQVYTSSNYNQAETILKNNSIDLVFLDVNLENEEGIQILKSIKAHNNSIDVVMLSGDRDPQLIVNAMREGASDYLCKPHPSEELIAVVEKNRKNKEVRDRYEALIEDMNENKRDTNFIGKSEIFCEVIEQANKLKGYGANVLIEGESGTGKELLAKYIHHNENNSKRPFIAVNCAAIPDALMESELFGHEQGAFTGAHKRKIGKFELANGGDIFLDEINSIKPELQAKLLRVLQEKEFYRVGGTQSIHVNFRVIAATNVNLSDKVSKGEFRQDLLYRLRVVTLTMPALSKRLDDLPVLVEHFLNKHSRTGQVKKISFGVLERLQSYSWPGNIRELENMIQSLIIMSPSNEINVSDLPSWLVKDNKIESDYENLPVVHFRSIQQSLKDYMRHVIRAKDGNVTKAAKILKVSRSKVYYTLKGEELN